MDDIKKYTRAMLSSFVKKTLLKRLPDTALLTIDEITEEIVKEVDSNFVDNWHDYYNSLHGAN